VKAFSETPTSGSFVPEWFRFYVRPLPKKAGRPEVHPISLLNSIVKIMNPLVLLKLVHWIQDEGLVSDIQFGFMTGKSPVDQLCRLMNDLEWKKGRQPSYLPSISKEHVTELTMSSSIAS
jgi:hypothetical protein